MRKKQRKNGFSLVEVVIALAIIASVTAAALTLVISSVAATENAIHVSKAQSFAGNVWECFKAAENKVKFRELVFLAEGVELTESTTDESENAIYTYYSEEHKFTAEIAVSFPENTRPELEVIVTDKDGDEIVSFSYRKGDGI